MTHFSTVQTFIDSARQVRCDDELEGLLDGTTETLGFDYFALLHHVDLTERPRSDVVALWTYPDAWVQEYFEERLTTADPVHLASHRTNVGFAWTEVSRLIPITAAHRRVRERTLQAGIADGFTVPANIPGEANGSCSFAVATGRKLPTKALPAAQLVGSFAFQAARALAYRKDGIDAPRRNLTPRQLDCLVLVGRGKTDGEIGTILGIAEDTVTEYLDDARRRYDVVKRIQLVMRVIFEGRIALSDILR